MTQYSRFIRRRKKLSFQSLLTSSSFFFQGWQWNRLSKEVLKAPSHALTAPQAKAKETIGFVLFSSFMLPFGLIKEVLRGL